MNSRVGIIGANTLLLEFPYGRELNEHIVQKLLILFQNSRDGCNRDNKMYCIPAFINHHDFEQLLQSEAHLRRDIQLSLEQVHVRPRVTLPNVRIYCLHGKHCIKAAEKFLAPHDRWWTIELYVLGTGKYG
jgi:hypothetical protein